MTTPYTVAAFYKFTPLDAPAEFKPGLAQALSALGACGSVLLAREGVNGTVAAPPDEIDRVVETLRALPGCADLAPKYSTASSKPFRRLKVRLKSEIVTMGVPGVDPNAAVGTYVDPVDWNALISAPGTLVVDTRNDYEVLLGTFEGATNPKTLSFREFPAWLERTVDDTRPERIAMFCTGGIRCEKATSHAVSEGLGDVYHLNGGILRYLEEIPKSESLWRGDCFVFDDRVSVTHGPRPGILAEGSAVLCRACKFPVPEADQSHPDCVPGVSCPRCVDKTSAEQKARFAERQRQIALAKTRGDTHLP